MNRRVLLIDDEPDLLAGLQRNLRRRFDVTTAVGAREGLAALAAGEPFAVVVTDFNMPDQNGIELLSQVRRSHPETVRMMLTGQADMQVAIDAVNAGHVFRFLCKPCNIDGLLLSLEAGVEQYRLITAERELLDTTLKGAIRMLVDLLAMVAPGSFRMVARLCPLARNIAERLHLDKASEVEIAVMLAPLGCLALPTGLVQRSFRADRMTPSDLQQYAVHAQVGEKLLAKIPRFEQIAVIVGSQFKRFDGGGFPADDRRGTAIPIGARILKVLLDFDAHRRNGESEHKALRFLRHDAAAYDPDVLDALESEISKVRDGFLLRSLPAHELEVGMVLAEDLFDDKGVLLIPQEQEVTELLKLRINAHLPEPNPKHLIKVLIPAKMVSEDRPES